MQNDERFCCRCGDTDAAAYWGPAHSLDSQYWLCQECMDSVLYLWVMEHYSLIQRFEQERQITR